MVRIHLILSNNKVLLIFLSSHLLMLPIQSSQMKELDMIISFW